jgi:hypothetical protein
MARAGARREADTGLGRLIEMATRDWGRGATRRLPPEFVTHMRAAVRETFLAVAALCTRALKAAEETTAAARRRVERIPVTRPAPTRRRTPSKRRG